MKRRNPDARADPTTHTADQICTVWMGGHVTSVSPHMPSCTHDLLHRMSRCTSNTTLIPITPNPGVDLPPVRACASSGVDVDDTDSEGTCATTLPLYTIFVPFGLQCGSRSLPSVVVVSLLFPVPSTSTMNILSSVSALKER